MPVAAAPARARTTPPSRVEPVGVRQDYIVQAESVEIARSAVVRVGGVVTGDLSIIRAVGAALDDRQLPLRDRKSTRLNSSHSQISYAVFCLKKKTHLMHEQHNASLSLRAVE